MFDLISVLFTSALVIGGAILLLPRLPLRRVVVYENQRGLLYRDGKFQRQLEPGAHRVAPYNTRVTMVDMRPKFVSIMGQEVLSQDGVTLKVSLAAKYEIADPYAAVHKIENFQTALYLILQLTLREIIGGNKIDDLLEQRENFGERLMTRAMPPIAGLGLRLLSADIKDIMFPGELKKIFSQVIKARKEGQAALEKARGETAALRNLANAAKLLEANPALLQLRALQHLGESSGNSLVFGVSAASVSLPIKTREIEEHRAGDENLPPNE